jgi:alpha-L-arabinofuranosidase
VLPASKALKGFNQNWSFLPSLNGTMLDNIKKLQPEILRYPGGTITHSWDWEKGIKIGSSTPPHPVKDIKTMVDATDASFVFVLDILNSSLDNQVDMLRAIEKLGVSINYIELGNELYSQDETYVAAFPTGAEYAAKVNVWVKTLKEVFPKAKISALLQCRNSGNSNARLNQWNNLVINGTNTKVDAYTYHIYIPEGGTFKSRIKEFEAVANVSNTGDKELWITEYGNQNDDASADYYKSLDSLANYVEAYPKVSMALNHLIVGNNKNKLTSDGLNFTKEGLMYLNRLGKR